MLYPKPKLILGLFLIIFIISHDLYAGCLACWKLFRVEIVLKNEELLDVYVQWNDEWLSNQSNLKGSGESFPAILLKLDPDKFKTLTAYEYYNLKEIQYPKEGLIVSLKKSRFIPTDSLKSVVLKKGIYDGYGGAGGIPVVDESVMKLLQKPPVAVCHYDSPPTDVYWLSYNPDVTIESLQWLCEDPWRRIIKYDKEFEENRIIKIEFGYD